MHQKIQLFLEISLLVLVSHTIILDIYKVPMTLLPTMFFFFFGSLTPRKITFPSLLRLRDIWLYFNLWTVGRTDSYFHVWFLKITCANCPGFTESNICLIQAHSIFIAPWSIILRHIVLTLVKAKCSLFSEPLLILSFLWLYYTLDVSFT